MNSVLGRRGGEAWLGLWNAHNRVPTGCVVQDSNASWSYASATVRAADNSSTYRASQVVGLSEDQTTTVYAVLIAAAANHGQSGIGLNSTTAHHAKSSYAYGNGGSVGSSAALVIPAPIGFNYYRHRGSRVRHRNVPWRAVFDTELHNPELTALTKVLALEARQ